jgi:DNA-binding response OmpR family regulator
MKAPDLILLDIQLPDIPGMDAARQLKADEETRAIPLIAVTAFARLGDREKILASGCDDYLAKPFNVREFLRMVALYTRPYPNGVKSDQIGGKSHRSKPESGHIRCAGTKRAGRGSAPVDTIAPERAKGGAAATTAREGQAALTGALSIG